MRKRAAHHGANPYPDAIHRIHTIYIAAPIAYRLREEVQGSPVPRACRRHYRRVPRSDDNGIAAGLKFLPNGLIQIHCARSRVVGRDSERSRGSQRFSTGDDRDHRALLDSKHVRQPQRCIVEPASRASSEITPAPSGADAAVACTPQADHRRTLVSRIAATRRYRKIL
jgi:hypothetical protein